MKRLVFAVAVLGLMACAKKEAGTPADSTAAPAAAPTVTTTTTTTTTTDTAKAPAPMADTTKMGGAKKK